MLSDTKTCPRCGRVVRTNTMSKSLRDNVTNICGICRHLEVAEVQNNEKYNGRVYWRKDVKQVQESIARL